MAGLDAFGITLERSDMAPTTPVFTPIGNVTNVSGPEIERETYDVTAHDSVDGWREFAGGLKDAGEVSVEVNFDVVEHGTLVSDFEDDKARDYKIVFPHNQGSWAFKAFMTGFTAESPVDDKQTGEMTFKVTGKPVLTVGTGV